MGDCVLEEKERLLEKKEGMQSGLNLREDRFRVPSGSSGRDHHLPSLSLPLSLSSELSFLMTQSSRWSPLMTTLID